MKLEVKCEVVKTVVASDWLEHFRCKLKSVVQMSINVNLFGLPLPAHLDTSKYQILRLYSSFERRTHYARYYSGPRSTTDSRLAHGRAHTPPFRTHPDARHMLSIWATRRKNPHVAQPAIAPRSSACLKWRLLTCPSHLNGRSVSIVFIQVRVRFVVQLFFQPPSRYTSSSLLIAPSHAACCTLRISHFTISTSSISLCTITSKARQSTLGIAYRSKCRRPSLRRTTYIRGSGTRRLTQTECGLSTTMTEPHTTKHFTLPMRAETIHSLKARNASHGGKPNSHAGTAWIHTRRKGSTA